jgi:hypothetical protein
LQIVTLTNHNTHHVARPFCLLVKELGSGALLFNEKGGTIRKYIYCHREVFSTRSAENRTKTLLKTFKDPTEALCLSPRTSMERRMQIQRVETSANLKSV